MARTREEIQSETKRLKKEYGDLFDGIAEILLRHDPIDINFGHNTDEYYPEVRSILSAFENVPLTARGDGDCAWRIPAMVRRRACWTERGVSQDRGGDLETVARVAFELSTQTGREIPAPNLNS